ncbi:MAG: hypothetical protein D6820_11665 [Lentisphaerae bacterium]|nr:MAG: hypothetical protein D6820_11665 [Lentisphaerota bacterium]
MKLRTNKVCFLTVSLAAMIVFIGRGLSDDDWKTRAATALKRGAAFLVKTQNSDGSWGEHKHPAIAALAIMGIVNTGVDGAENTINKGLSYILKFQQPEGSIYPADVHRENMTKSAYYPNYSTAVILLCLTAVDRKEYYPVMLRARRYLMSIQFRDPSTVDFGGIGYGKTQRADLSNTAWATEALYYSEFLEKEPYMKDPAAMKHVKEMWKGVDKFITQCQNLPELNKAPYVSNHPDDLGGFYYRPTESKAGVREDPKDGVSNLVSSGSMTYAGLKTMLYAKIDRNDPRVKGAISYLKRHYTLDENPGMGKQGLLYYYLTMAKALTAYGADTFVDARGGAHDWRKELAERLLSMQKPDGSWANTNGRFFESDPTLATGYVQMILKILTGKDDLTRHLEVSAP